MVRFTGPRARWGLRYAGEPAPAPRLTVLSNSSMTKRESSQALANLRRAVTLPWEDDGRCVVAAANNPWRVVVERCFHALDREKVRFRDVQHRCPVASVDAAEVQAMVGFCLLVQPELVVGAVVVASAFVVAVAIVQAQAGAASRLYSWTGA